MRIDTLVQRLGVSKGSFYHHFESRENFLLALAEFWKYRSTQAVVEALRDIDGSPRDRLRQVLEFIVENEMAKMDVPIRAFARIEPSIAPIIRESDEIRFRTIRGLFEEMGFSDDELDARTCVFVGCHSFESSLSTAPSKEEILKQIPARIDFFTRSS